MTAVWKGSDTLLVVKFTVHGDATCSNRLSMGSCNEINHRHLQDDCPSEPMSSHDTVVIGLPKGLHS